MSVFEECWIINHTISIQIFVTEKLYKFVYGIQLFSVIYNVFQLFGDPEEREEKYLRRIFSLRQKALLGEPI